MATVNKEVKEIISGIIVDLSEHTSAEINRILCMTAGEFVKEFGTEQDRADKDKIGEVRTMNRTLNFLINLLAKYCRDDEEKE